MQYSLNKRAAFTLIELSAVLVLMAVLAGTAAVMLAGPRRRAVAADAVGQVAFADEQARRAAIAGGVPVELIFDLAAGRVSRGAEGSTSGTTLAELPAGVRVMRVVVGREATDFGQVRVAISTRGVSRSYAVGLATPAGERWVVVAGLTGQATAAADGAAADAVVGVSAGE